MQSRGWHDFVQFDENGDVIDYRFYDYESDFGLDHGGEISAPSSEVASHANGGTLTGTLSNEDGGDMIAVELVAGQTYTFSYRGTADGVVDPWLRIYASDMTTLLAQDDDGGYGRTSQITFTATSSGTYYLNATSWYQVDPAAPDYQDNGSYTISVWSPEAGHDAGNTIATAGSIEVGTNYQYLETAGDRDYYAIELVAGNVYTFTYNGGVASEAVDAGESIGVLGLYNSAGANVSGGLFYSSAGETSITFVAQTSGTYYLRAEALSNFFGGTPMTGGYTIDVTERPFEDYDPLESLNWDSASNIPTVDVDGVQTAYVYFAAAGEDVGTGETTYGWQQHQIDAVMHALNTQYSPITNINYVITTDIDEATFRMITVQNNTYGARFYPQDPAYGSLAGIGSFNLLSGGFGTDPNSLLPGGYSYEVILHEFGHAHGIAHPHDTGGGSEVMLGVTRVGNNYTLGLYDLNQGVYTVMSYNSGWSTHPDGDRNYSALNRASGWNETLGAFDIAVLQARYGTWDNNTGDNVYLIADTQPEATYQTIWDTGGTDTIAYVGTRDAHIDLLAATLDYSPTGGGVISFARGVWGGYTIANGVVIENASGGSGNDVLIGNSASNVLTGNAGNDVLMGRGGGDTLDGGDGFDTASYRDSASGVTASLATMSGSAGDAAGDVFIGIEALEGSDYADTLIGGDANDTLSGLAGDDLLSGNNGDDLLNGGAGNDTLNGGNGVDVLNGDSGNDTLNGGNGDDVLNGGAGDDTLVGGNGNDRLNGGSGNNTLNGGRGSDTFVFTAPGTNTIVGYEVGEDIDLSGLNVTAEDVTITSTGIFVDLEGAEDLSILFNTRGFSWDDMIFAPQEEAAAAALALAASGGGTGDYMFI